MDANKKIGIPAGLLYYMYQDLWLNFFHDIGCDVVVSGNTTYDIAKKELISVMMKLVYRLKCLWDMWIVF